MGGWRKASAICGILHEVKDTQSTYKKNLSMKYHVAPSYVLSAILLAVMLSVANSQQPSAAGQGRGVARSSTHRWMEMDKNGDEKLTVEEFYRPKRK